MTEPVIVSATKPLVPIILFPVFNRIVADVWSAEIGGDKGIPFSAGT